MSEFVDCRTCKSDCVRADGNYGYTFCDKYTHPPMTNADCIRAMSDKELVVFLDGFSSRCLECAEYAENKSCPIYKNGHYCSPQDIMKWLQQPAEEEEHDRRTEIKH